MESHPVLRSCGFLTEQAALVLNGTRAFFFLLHSDRWFSRVAVKAGRETRCHRRCRGASRRRRLAFRPRRHELMAQHQSNQTYEHLKDNARLNFVYSSRKPRVALGRLLGQYWGKRPPKHCFWARTNTPVTRRICKFNYHFHRLTLGALRELRFLGCGTTKTSVI